MSAMVLQELETAAQIILAPPNVVNAVQRQSAEKIFLEFRKTKNPYILCREILETSTCDFVLFEAADLLKNALIREWSALQESDVLSLRQYLLQYVTQKQVQSFIRDRILQVIAIIVKRASVDDFGVERSQILTDVENLIMNGDLQKQMLGFNLIETLMREYATTVKCADVGLPWEGHLRAKKQFEATDLRKIFQFCLQIVSEIIKSDPPYNESTTIVLKHTLKIIENVLTWGYIAPMLPKRVIGFFEAVYESDQAPALRLSALWKDIVFDAHFLPLMFSTYWKVRSNPDLGHHALSSLVQLASLNGPIVNKKEIRVQYLRNYMESFLNLITSLQLQGRDYLGISNVIRKLVIFFLSNGLAQLPDGLVKSFLENITRLTCGFAEGASKEQSLSEDKYYSEAFDNILEAWSTLLLDLDCLSMDIVKPCAIQIFNTYLQTHLTPPHGTRSIADLESEEIDEAEDNDRTKFKDQLQIIGTFGRHILDHSLLVLVRLLEEKTQQLNAHLRIMQTQAMTIAESKTLDSVFEDIHWTVLISGHVLCMESEGETPLIPADVTNYSMEQTRSGRCSNEVTLKYLASVQCSSAGDLGLDLERCDRVVRLTAAVLKLCAVETFAAEAKLGHFMSPEVGCSLMWFLHRWALSYLLPHESYYSEMSPQILNSFGRDAAGAEFVVRFILAKIQSNICHFHSEPILLQDTVRLFVSLVERREKGTYIVKSSGFWALVDLQLKLEPGVVPQTIRRGLYKCFILAGAALEDPNDQTEYWKRILTPIQIRFKTILCQENFNRIYQQENVQAEIIDILESFIGVASGSQITTVDYLFTFLCPILSELSTLLNLYHNYQIIVQLVLELFCECTKRMLCYLTHAHSRKLYEYCLATVRTYAGCNSNRFTTEMVAEECNFQDLLLVMELLANLLAKDCLDLAPFDDANANANESESNVTAADVVLFGLSFVMPLMTIDLLKYPALCTQYYKLITFVNEIYPQKVCDLPVDLLRKLLGSIELGLTQFGSEVIMSCLDFVQVLATQICTNGLQNAPVYNLLMPMLKFLLDLILGRQINSDLFNATSTSLFALICCYSEQYKQYVEHLIRCQSDATVAERLANAFTELTTNVQLKPERLWKLKFRDNFDAFIVNVYGFLMIK